jgi:phage gp36-like protein
MYSTLQDLIELQGETTLLQLSDDANIGSFVTVLPYNTPYLVILQVIADADSVIDSYLSGRYTLPIPAPIPAIIKQISANLAVCNLFVRRRELDAPEGIKLRHDRNLKLLKDIKAGLASVPELETTAVNIAPAAFLVSKTASDQVFNDSLLNMM